MKRRLALYLIGASLWLGASLAFTQPARKPVRVGVLSSSSPESRSRVWDAFKDGMTKLGWVEGLDVVYVYRYTRGDTTRFGALAAELVAERPDLLYGGTQDAALALKRATREIPIVFALAPDPVGSGLVASLAHPGGNATGLSTLGAELHVKRLQLLKEIQPRLRRVTVFGFMTENEGKQAKAEAHAMGLELQFLQATSVEQIGPALDAMTRNRPEGIMVTGGAVTFLEKRRVIDRIAELRVPAIYISSQFVTAGGLMSYGHDISVNFRHAASFVDRILRGAKPADLPVEQPVIFESVVNLKAAQAQGITIPQSVLLRATRVIE